jgi:hypothetical protein
MLEKKVWIANRKKVPRGLLRSLQYTADSARGASIGAILWARSRAKKHLTHGVGVIVRYPRKNRIIVPILDTDPRHLSRPEARWRLSVKPYCRFLRMKLFSVRG